MVLSDTATEAIKTSKVNDKSGLYVWAFSRSTLVSRLKKQNKDDINTKEKRKEEENSRTKATNDEGTTEDDILEILEGDTRLVCISISDPYTIKDLSISISQELLKRRKRQFKVKPHILFVFDDLKNLFTIYLMPVE